MSHARESSSIHSNQVSVEWFISVASQNTDPTLITARSFGKQLVKQVSESPGEREDEDI